MSIREERRKLRKVSERGERRKKNVEERKLNYHKSSTGTQ
jgi:hypothetical protein